MTTTKIRASSWGRLFDCAYSWEGTALLKLHSPGSPRSLLGTAIHAGTAAFDTARMLLDPISVFDAAGVLVDELQHPKEEISWAGSDLTLRDAESIGIKLLNRYCTEWSPRFEFRAVELTTKPLVIDCGGGVLVELTGTLDRARFASYGNGAGIKDLKSGMRAVSKGQAVTKGHAAQIGTYEILYEHTTGEPITEDAEIIALATSGKGEIATGTITGAKQMMLGDEQHKGLIQIGADMLRTGLFAPNPQSRLCDKRYCPRWNTCPYHL